MNLSKLDAEHSFILDKGGASLNRRLIESSKVNRELLKRFEALKLKNVTTRVIISEMKSFILWLINVVMTSQTPMETFFKGITYDYRLRGMGAVLAFVAILGTLIL